MDQVILEATDRQTVEWRQNSDWIGRSYTREYTGNIQVNQTKRSFAEKNLCVLVDSELKMRQQCTFEPTGLTAYQVVATKDTKY